MLSFLKYNVTRVWIAAGHLKSFNLSMSKQRLTLLLTIIIIAAAGAYLISENPVDKSGLTQAYTSADYGFSFKYPEEFSASELDDDSGHTVLLQTSDAREGFQIFISAFDEPFDPAQGKSGPITPERIKQDLPDMLINSPQQVLIGEQKDIPALIFLSKHESLGDVREVWFVVNGFLYQLTAYADLDNFIGPILETLSFE